jgi:hypothetical protein
VLVGAAMPAVLVELGFISNPDEEKKLQDPAYRGQLVDALARAIAKYKAAVEGQPAAPASGAVPSAQPPTAAQPAPAAPAPSAAPAPKPAKPPATTNRSGKPR